MTESSKGVLLVVDDEPLKRATLQIELSGAGYTVLEASDALSASKVLNSRAVDVVVTDIRMPEVDGLEFLERIKARFPRTHVILMTAYGSVNDAVDAIKRGAYDYITKPFSTDVLIEKLERLLAGRSPGGLDEERGLQRLGSLVGRSYASRRLFEQVRNVANNDRPVLIRGEAGTRRDRVAETIHRLGPRSSGPLVKFNCRAAGPEDLGAALFDQASGGTLFLDEVEALPVEAQTRLLLALESGSQGGGGGDGQARARLICGATENLQQLLEERTFREDLYYRIAASNLVITPLRERREDIPVLIEDCLRRCADSAGDGAVPVKMSAHAMDVMMSYHWPGNVRELEHTLERALPLASGSEITSRDILLPRGEEKTGSEAAMATEAAGGLTETIAGVERSLIDAALRSVAGNQAKAAKTLGIPRTTLRDKMAKYGMVSRSEKE